MRRPPLSFSISFVEKLVLAKTEYVRRQRWPAWVFYVWLVVVTLAQGETCLGLAELTGHADAESDGDRRGLSLWAHGWQRHRVGV